MKSKIIISSFLGSLFLNAGSWNDFTWRYSGAGHIPSIPLYFRAPLQCEPIDPELKEDIQNIRYNLDELKTVVSQPKEQTQILTHNMHLMSTKCSRLTLRYQNLLSKVQILEHEIKDANNRIAAVQGLKALSTDSKNATSAMRRKSEKKEIILAAATN